MSQVFIENFLPEIRKQLDITQEQLAAVLGVSKQHISNIENGRTDPKISLCILIAKALDVEIKDIFRIITE